MSTALSTPVLPSAVPMPSASTANVLTRPQKAAVIVRYLLAEGADIWLADLAEDKIAEPRAFPASIESITGLRV